MDNLTIEDLRSQIQNSRKDYENWAHKGYMDGILGLPPDSKFEYSTDYEQGWLIGSELTNNIDRLRELLPCLYKKGDLVTIPKGVPYFTTARKGGSKTGKKYTVQVFRAGYVTQASMHRNVFYPPKAAEITWVGSGGYYCDVSANLVQPAEQITDSQSHT